MSIWRAHGYARITLILLLGAFIGHWNFGWFAEFDRRFPGRNMGPRLQPGGARPRFAMAICPTGRKRRRWPLDFPPRLP